MQDQPPAIHITGLRKTYGSRHAFDGLDLGVPPGVVYGFLGPNGAGKTTTMRILAGVIRPDAGSVELFGRPVGWLDRAPLSRIGALIEAPASGTIAIVALVAWLLLYALGMGLVAVAVQAGPSVQVLAPAAAVVVYMLLAVAVAGMAARRVEAA